MKLILSQLSTKLQLKLKLSLAKSMIKKHQYCFANISATKAQIFMKFYVVVNQYLVIICIKQAGAELCQAQHNFSQLPMSSGCLLSCCWSRSLVELQQDTHHWAGTSNCNKDTVSRIRLIIRILLKGGLISNCFTSFLYFSSTQKAKVLVKQESCSMNLFT